MAETTTVTLYVPTPLRSFVGGDASVEVQGSTVGEALEHLVNRHPKLQSHLYNESGELRSFVNIYKNDEDVRYLDGEQTPLQAGDVLAIVPSIAGG